MMFLYMSVVNEVQMTRNYTMDSVEAIISIEKYRPLYRCTLLLVHNYAHFDSYFNVVKYLKY